MEGPFTSTLLVGSVSYRLSQKWITELSATYDLGTDREYRRAIGITRVGESALVRIAVNADHGRDNVGAAIHDRTSFPSQWPPRPPGRRTHSPRRSHGIGVAKSGDLGSEAVENQCTDRSSHVPSSNLTCR